MKELEKIMEEIETEFEIRINTQLKIISGLNDDVYRYGYGKSLEAYQQGKLLASEIIRKHMNDGWIPVEERPPEEPGRYNVTFRSDGSVQEIGYGSCRADVLGFPIGYGWYDLYSATYFSDDAILAWSPLPEPYDPKK